MLVFKLKLFTADELLKRAFSRDWSQLTIGRGFLERISGTFFYFIQWRVLLIFLIIINGVYFPQEIFKIEEEKLTAENKQNKKNL